MDTPLIAKYYSEQDPMKRRKILEKSIAEGEEPEKNAVRKEIWEVRYSDKTEVSANSRADGFLRLWMNLGFNKNAAGKFGAKGARKSLVKEIDKLKIVDVQNKSELHKELMYREYIHLVNLYIGLCKDDKSYTTYLCGIMKYKEDDIIAKLRKDVWATGVDVPKDFKLEEELGLLMKATEEVFKLHFEEDDDLF